MKKVMSDFTPIVLFRLKIKYDMKNKKHAFFIKTIFITQWASKAPKPWKYPASNAWAAIFKIADFSCSFLKVVKLGNF